MRRCSPCQRPEADDEEIPLLRDYANREAAQHRAETEENDIPLLQQYLKRPPLSQVMPQERHQAPAQPRKDLRSRRARRHSSPRAGRPRSRRRAFPHPVRRVPKRRGPAGRKSGTRT